VILGSQDSLAACRVETSRVLAIHCLGVASAANIPPQRPAAVPLMVSPAARGFPSPADDYLDGPLDFNELLIQNPAATFAVRIAGESMTGVGLFPEPIGDPTR
jgi:SOS-response transcriptional repressor LexA